MKVSLNVCYKLKINCSLIPLYVWISSCYMCILLKSAIEEFSMLYLWYCRQLILCRVTLGKSFLQFSAIKMAHAPPGHHSIIGRPSSGGLMFPEYVVYRGEQVLINNEFHFSHFSIAVVIWNTFCSLYFNMKLGFICFLFAYSS